MAPKLTHESRRITAPEPTRSNGRQGRPIDQWQSISASSDFTADDKLCRVAQ